MLRWRLLLGTLIVAALVAACALDAKMPRESSGALLLPLALIAAVLATQEVLNLAAAGNMRPLRWPVYVGNLLIVAGAWKPIYEIGLHSVGFGLASPLLGLAIAVLLSLLGELWHYRQPGGNMANVAAAAFTLVYVGFMLSFAVQLRLWWGVAGLASWIIVVKMGDIGAYTVGRLIGRHKMAPLLSPGKTIEGAVGRPGILVRRGLVDLSLAGHCLPARMVENRARGGAGSPSDCWSAPPAWRATCSNRCSNATSAARTPAIGCPVSAACSTSSILSCFLPPWRGFAGRRLGRPLDRPRYQGVARQEKPHGELATLPRYVMMGLERSGAGSVVRHPFWAVRCRYGAFALTGIH